MGLLIDRGSRWSCFKEWCGNLEGDEDGDEDREGVEQSVLRRMYGRCGGQGV
jgi:hypothetical protein